MFGAVVVADGVAVGVLTLGAGVFLSLIGWNLTQAVRLGQIVSRLESQTTDLERRVERLEQA